MIVNDEIAARLNTQPTLARNSGYDLKIEFAGVRVWLSEGSIVVIERVVGGFWEWVEADTEEKLLAIIMENKGI